MKIFGLLVFILIGIGITVARFLRNTRSKKRGNQIVNLIDSDPQLAEDLAEDLQNIYVSFPKNGLPLRQIIEPITEKVQLGKFQVLKKFELKSGDFLIISLCHHTSFDVGMDGKLGDKKEISQYNFTVRVNHSTQKIDVCSEYFIDLNDKFLRKEFGDALAHAISKS